MTTLIGWLGVVFGMFISIPQICKSYKSKSVDGVSLRTYQILFIAILCYLTRAIAIGEAIFIVSNSLNLTICCVMLILFRRYNESRNRERTSN